MLIGFLFVSALDHDEFVGGFDCDFVWCELLHVQNDLEFVAVHVQCWAGSLALQVIAAPWTNVAAARNRWRRIPEWRQQIVASESYNPSAGEKKWSM